LRREQTPARRPVVAPGQRALIDGGAYVSAAYLALDDAIGNHRVLRQYDGTLYARVNLDGVHELFFRGIAGWRDFNDGDSFDGRGDERIDPDVERLFYRFDLGRAKASTAGSTAGRGCRCRWGAIWSTGATASC
jgi:hypothetical protein